MIRRVDVHHTHLDGSRSKCAERGTPLVYDRGVFQAFRCPADGTVVEVRVTTPSEGAHTVSVVGTPERRSRTRSNKV